MNSKPWCLFACVLLSGVAMASEPVTTRAWQEAVVSVSDLDQGARFFIEIDSLAALHTRLGARGYPPASAAQPLRLPPYGRFAVLTVTTPDGALIQFLERAAAP
jgi:hypothetical protein